MSLSAVFYGFLLIVGLLIGLGTVIFGRDQVLKDQNAAMEIAVGVRLQGAVVDLDRTLQSDWTALTAMARQLEGRVAGPEAQQLVTLTLAQGTRFSWVGIIAVDGKVLAAAKNVGVGAEVADLAWFKFSLAQDYGALAEGPPAAFVTTDGALIYATPVRNANGRVTGVAAAFIDTVHLQSHLLASAQALGLDLFLTAPDGRVVAATQEAALPKSGLINARAVAIGNAATQAEIWPDGKRYFSAIMSPKTGTASPELGWQLLARIDPVEFAQINRGAVKAFAVFAALLLAAVGALSWLFARHFLAPFSSLAISAVRSANGVDEYPFEGEQTMEISMISAALTRLRGQIDRSG